MGVALRAAGVAVLAGALLGAPACTTPAAAQVEAQLNAYGESFLIDPARLLDTREAATPVVEAQPLVVAVAGHGGIPTTGSSMAILNVTVTEATAASEVRVSVSGEAEATHPQLRFRAGETVPVLVVTRLGADGAVVLSVAAGSAHVVVDAVGWFADETVVTPGGRLTSVVPWRALDTRTSGGLAASQVIDVVVGQPGLEATGVVVNLTGTDTTSPTYVTAYPGDQPVPPQASNLNPIPGETRPNVAFVRMSPEGTIRLANGPGATNVIVDVLGYLASGPPDSTAGRVVPLQAPFRSLDTRDDGAALQGGNTDGWSFDPFTASTGVPVRGLVANLTASQAEAPSFITSFPLGTPQPSTSTLNLVPGQQATNLVVTDLAQPGGGLAVFGLAGTAHYALDVVAVVVGDGWTPTAPLLS